MNYLVTAIIPVYNTGIKLIRCVESLVYGKYKDLQIILIDDCSKDNSWDYCLYLSEKYENVLSVKNDINSGASFSRSRGIEIADSKYIVFVDSDDWVSKDYLRELVQSVEKYPGSLSMCGICFIDEVNNYRRNYLWNSEKKEILIKKEDYFSLVDNFFIQSPCNKIFELDIIKNNKLKFDVNQSMGEDFQFVLDYMKCLKTDYSVIINKPLYYYLRYSNTSLMGSFGIKEKNHEFSKRLEQLYNIIGNNTNKVKIAYKQSLQNTLNSYVYSICRNKSITDNEKIILIEYVMNDNRAKEHLKEQMKCIRKENLYKFLLSFKKIRPKFINRLIGLMNKKIINKNKRLLSNSEFSIISQNCIGGVIYNDLGLKFLSPTINLYFSADDFLKFISRLEYYISLELEMRWDEEYPIGILDDITIHFMHYSNCSEAKDAWNRRKKRINFEKLLVISTDMEGFNELTFNQWKNIKYPKVLLSSKNWDDQSCVFYRKYEKDSCVPDLIPKREFYKDDCIIKKINFL